MNPPPVAPAWHGFAVVRRRPAAIAADGSQCAEIATGWQIEMAGREPADAEALARQLLAGPDGALPADTLVHRDDVAGLYRAAAFVDDELAGALLIAPQPLVIARDWLAARLGTPLDPAERFRLLDGRPSGAMRPRGQIVCFCCNVGENEIVDAAAAGSNSVHAIGVATRAGTNCKRCQPELARLIAGASVRA